MTEPNFETELRLAEVLTALNDIQDIAKIASDPIDRDYVVGRVLGELKEWLPSQSMDQLLAISNGVVDALALVNLIPVEVQSDDDPVDFELTETAKVETFPFVPRLVE